MSAPRLVLCGVEPGPAVALAAGALLAAFAEERGVRPVLLGADLPLWRLLHTLASRAPRVLDPKLVDDAVAGELCQVWEADVDLTLVVAVEPALDRWEGVEGSRAVDVAHSLDAPLTLVVDACDRGASAAAAACGTRMLADGAEYAGVLVVGGADPGGDDDLRRLLEESCGLPVLGWIPPRLSGQFIRQYEGGRDGLRLLGPPPVGGGDAALCREAAVFLDREGLAAAAARRGYVPARPRRRLVPSSAAGGLTLAVAWGPPLEPPMLDAADMFKAMGVTLAPLQVTRDTGLPERASGLLIAGLLDEDRLAAFAANEALKAALRDAVVAGLPVLALGGGALLLLRRLADGRGRAYELAGVLPAEAEVLEWYGRPRYVDVVASPDNPYVSGELTLCELFDLEFLTLQQDKSAWRLGGRGEERRAEGFVRGRCLATTLVPSLPATPGLAETFVAAMRPAPDA